MRPEKASIIENLREKLNASPFLIVTDYTGLKVDQFSELRTRLAEAGAECRVVKNTMLRIAAKEVGLPDFAASLEGQTAVVLGESDVCAAAKTLKVFASEFEKPVLKIGVLDSALLTVEQIHALADLPSLDILRAQFLALLQTPATQLVRVLNEPGTSLARVLKAKFDAAGE